MTTGLDGVAAESPEIWGGVGTTTVANTVPGGRAATWGDGWRIWTTGAVETGAATSGEGVVGGGTLVMAARG